MRRLLHPDRVATPPFKAYDDDGKLVSTGASHARWPPGLLPAVTIEFGPVASAPSTLIKRGQSELRRYARIARFMRAIFLASCAVEARLSSPDPERLIQRWKRSLLYELSLDLEQGPITGLHTWAQPCYLDDIPF